MQRKASAVWQGDMKDGKGSITTESGVLSATPYSFSTRFEGAPGSDRAKFEAAAAKAKAGCPVSKVLNAAITMNARLAA